MWVTTSRHVSREEHYNQMCVTPSHHNNNNNNSKRWRKRISYGGEILVFKWWLWCVYILNYCEIGLINQCTQVKFWKGLTSWVCYDAMIIFLRLAMALWFCCIFVYFIEIPLKEQPIVTPLMVRKSLCVATFFLSLESKNYHQSYFGLLEAKGLPFSALSLVRKACFIFFQCQWKQARSAFLQVPSSAHVFHFLNYGAKTIPWPYQRQY